MATAQKFSPSTPQALANRVKAAIERTKEGTQELPPSQHGNVDMIVQCITRYNNSSIPSRIGHTREGVPAFEVEKPTKDTPYLNEDQVTEFRSLREKHGGDKDQSVSVACAAKALGYTGQDVEIIRDLVSKRKSPAAQQTLAWSEWFLANLA